MFTSSSAATTNAKALSLDRQIAYTKQQVKHDKRVIKKFLWRLHRHQRKLKELQGLKRIYSLSPISAIRFVFGAHASEGITVAACESGGGDPNRIDIYAENGQYKGMFQMGSNERDQFATIGYSTAYQQTVAAKNYFDYEVDHGSNGWSPWDCQPY